MKFPRNLSGVQLAHLLGRLGYQVARQTGAHLRLTTTEPAEHHITVPNHDCLRVGTLAAIPRDVADFHGMSRDELLDFLFSRSFQSIV
jgi:predicted RNA binding protein YcfA (HicA-like mRNA interferase family)